MQGHLLLISDRPDDLKLFLPMSTSMGLKIERQLKPEGIQAFLNENKQAVVVWDAENAFIYPKIEGILKQAISPIRLFALGGRSFQNAAYINKYPIFGHHLVRCDDPVSNVLYEHVLRAAFTLDASGLEKFFPPGTDIPSLVIKHTSQKQAATQAIQNVLKKRGIPERIASLVAQGVDELVLNAIFDAPIDRSGNKLKQNLERSTEMALNQKEQVTVRLAFSDAYMGVSVTDQFGSLSRVMMMEAFLKRMGKNTELGGQEGFQSKIGLNRVLQSGLSLLFFVNSHSYTEVMLFFKLTENYKAFRSSFQFLSLMMS